MVDIVDIALCICDYYCIIILKMGVMSQVNDNYVVCIAVPSFGKFNCYCLVGAVNIALYYRRF